MIVHFIKHCRLIKITQFWVQSMFLFFKGGLCGWGLWQEQPIRGKLPATTCMTKRPCHVRRRAAARLVAVSAHLLLTFSSCLLVLLFLRRSECVGRYAAECAELPLLLPAAVCQRGQGAWAWGADWSHAQTFSLSPKIQVWRHPAGASWGILREWDHVSHHVCLTQYFKLMRISGKIVEVNFSLNTQLF